MLRIVVAVLLASLLGFTGPVAAAGTASPGKNARPDILETMEQVFYGALREAVGAPARADIGDQATDRLSDDLVIVPQEHAVKLLTMMRRPVPPDLTGLLLGSEGMDSAGVIRFVPAGFIDGNQALAWTPGDMLSSIAGTVERANAERLKQNQPALEVRRWIRPPQYDPETHQLSWATLILPKSASQESGGEFTYNAIGFGREGYVHLTIVTSVEKAETIGRAINGFLAGLHFRPGKAYDDAVPADRRAPDGLAGAMGVDSLHKMQTAGIFWGTGSVVPIAGGIVGLIGGLSLLIYIQRHRRQEARRG